MRPIHMLHRGHSNHVAIYTATGPNLRPECGLPAWDLERYFSGIVGALERDSFFTVNGFWHAPQRESKHRVGPARLVWAQRKEKQLQRINAAFADLDCHTLGLTPGQTIGELIDLQDAQQIPPISMLTKSGRGVWCFWLLRDRDGYQTRQGQRATRLAVPWAKSLQRAIAGRLGHLGADRNGMDLCRLTRVPGSVNSKSGNRVEHWIRRDEIGEVATYSMEELGQWFDCPQPQIPQPTGKPRHPNLLPAAEGQQRRWEKDTERFIKLMRHRGNIPEGQRGAAVFLWVTCLRRIGLRGTSLQAEADRLWPLLQNENCSHLFTREQFQRQIARESAANPSHQAISQMLHITAVESEVTGWPAHDHLTRIEKRRLRHEIIREVHTQHSEYSISPGRLAMLIAERDMRLKCDRTTVMRDLKLLNIRSGVQNSG